MKLRNASIRFVLGVLVGTTVAQAQTASALPPPPEHPVTAEQVHRFYQVAGMQKLLQELIGHMLSAMKATSANSVPESVWKQMQTDFDNYDFEAAIAPAYQRFVSQEDMAATLAYMESDSARRMRATEPFIQQMVGEVTRNAGRDIGEKAARDHMAEIEALQRKNDAAAAARVGGKSAEQPSIVLPPATSK